MMHQEPDNTSRPTSCIAKQHGVHTALRKKKQTNKLVNDFYCRVAGILINCKDLQLLQRLRDIAY